MVRVDLEGKKENVCAYCGEETVAKDKSSCCNRDIISKDEYCFISSWLHNYAANEADELMRFSQGENYETLVCEIDDTEHYTEEGQDIFNQFFDDIYRNIIWFMSDEKTFKENYEAWRNRALRKITIKYSDGRVIKKFIL